MRSHKTFTRNIGTTPTLGADPVNPNTPMQPTNADNVMAARPQTLAGQTARRICVFYSSSVGGAVALQARAWFYEQATQRWYAIEAAKTLNQDQGTFFDVPSASEPVDPNNAGTTIHCYLQVSDNAAAAGSYTFAMVSTQS